MASCPHLSSSNISPPKVTDSVYREDCTICFDSIDDTAGLDVCLHCFNGGCAGDRHHSLQHAQQSKHPLAVNITRTRKRQERPEGEPPEKITKLAIQAETEQDRYDTQTDVRCLECGVQGLTKDGQVGQAVEAILKANTFATDAEVKAWEEEIIPCEHTLCLEQEPPNTISSDRLGQCKQCDLKENLWLCLTCGNLGCGRKFFMGMGPPGNNHQVEHNKATGHPVAVKLGSLTAEGNADIHCYACDEERSDPELVAHLANWGIDISGRVKTEKSVIEMQLEHNLNYDFSMTTADGQELKALYGAGLTGLKNLGNSCYIASVLQSLFSIPEFQDRYYNDAGQHIEPSSTAAQNLEIQLRKVADGLLSGRYSMPDKSLVGSSENNEETWQRGLAPSMLKHLVGKGHPEFSTMRQQDAFEFLMHLLRLITRSESKPRPESAGKPVKNPVDVFKFAMEQKLQCLNCHKVRYRQDEMENISITVPVRRKADGDTAMTNGEKEEKKDEFEAVTLTEGLENFTAPEIVELICPSCSEKRFSKSQRFKTFPTILAVNARRFELVNWVPTKRDVPVIVGDDAIDFEPYRCAERNPQEEELPDDTDAGGGASGFTPNAVAVQMLMEMGFPKVRCEKALYHTGNQDPDVAAAWLFEHMDDPDIDEPAEFQKEATKPDADPEKLEMLEAMGFSAPMAKRALQETDGDLERAADWLFSHPDEEPLPEAESSSAPANNVSDKIDARPAQFLLDSIVCHKGASIHAGHYVAFVKKALPDGTKNWVLFNDEKVALGGDVEEMKKFAYIYFLRRSAD